ncbi:MAG: CBS domain-containing protein [Myxococcota bacterium]
MSTPAVQSYMTPCPVTIQRGSSLSQADALMRQHRIRHLPVVDGQVLVGLLSQRDIQLLSNLRGLYGDDITVEETMSTAPLQVASDTSVEAAAQLMWERKFGSVIVADRGKIVGLFTTTDALRALIELLARARHKPV